MPIEDYKYFSICRITHKGVRITSFWYGDEVMAVKININAQGDYDIDAFSLPS